MCRPNPFLQSTTYSSFCEDVMHLGQTRAVMLADQSGISGAEIARWIARFNGRAPLNSEAVERVAAPVPFRCA